MSALEIISLSSLSLGVAAILRFAWIDSLRFVETRLQVADTAVTRATVERLAIQADRMRRLDAEEAESLPKAA